MTEKKKKDELFDKEKEAKEEKKLGPVAPKDLATASKPAPGTENIRSEDTTFPRFRLLQSTSTEVEEGSATAGLIKHSITEEAVKSIEIIPLCMILTRVMFNAEDRKGAPICRSNDMEFGSGCDCGCDSVCAKCTFEKWDKGMPPVCSLVYNYPVLTPTQIGRDAMPTLLSFMKSSTQSALKMNTTVKSSFPPVPFWNHVWSVTATPKKFKKGSAYIFNVKKLRDTTEEERSWASNVYYACIAGRKVDIDVEAQD